MSDIYIFGDVGGHYEPFLAALGRIGITEMAIPKGTIIIQVGDLVHRGPQSDELVAWVDEIMAVNNKDPERGRWIQLFGNHEGHHIGGPRFAQSLANGEVTEWELSKESEKTLKKWWHSGQAYMAAAIHRDDLDRDVLVTHAGLCFQTWAGLGFPEGVAETAKVVNAQKVKLAFAPGLMLGGYMKSSTGDMQPPGVAWAAAAQEVYPSWIDRDGMFDQVHGHSTLWNWYSNKSYADKEITAGIERRPALRFTRWTNKSGSHYYCVDQGLGKNPPRFDVEPLKITGTVLEPAGPPSESESRHDQTARDREAPEVHSGRPKRGAQAGA